MNDYLEHEHKIILLWKKLQNLKSSFLPQAVN